MRLGRLCPLASLTLQARMSASSQDARYHRSRHVRQPHVASLVAIGEAEVVKAEEMEQRRVQIVHVHRVLLHVEAEVVRLAVDRPGTNAAAGQERGEGV